jgi:tRNA (guanine-N7-)-methyltransferase
MKTRYVSLKPYIPWRRVERPINWTQYFGGQAPLEVEIGFGNGDYLVRQAQHHPERNFVGIELEWGSVQRGLRKIAQAHVPNVRLLQVDARIAMQRLFRPRSLHLVRALFPCPWPKDRHIKHRLFSQAFLQLLNSRLVCGGEVHIVTDHAGYVHWLLEQVPESGFELEWHTVPPRFSTKYERKWRDQGQERFFDLRLRQHACLTVPSQKDITLQSHRVSAFDPAQFSPPEARGAIVVICKDFIFDPRRQKGMLLTLVAEESLTQDFWIEIARQNEHWYIRPARGCAVIPTAGVQRALDLVRDATDQSVTP